MKRIIIAILIVSACATYAIGKMGMDLGLELGSGSVTVSGPVTAGIDYDGAWSVYTDAWSDYTTAWE